MSFCVPGVKYKIRLGRHDSPFMGNILSTLTVMTFQGLLAIFWLLGIICQSFLPLFLAVNVFCHFVWLFELMVSFCPPLLA